VSSHHTDGRYIVVYHHADGLHGTSEDGLSDAQRNCANHNGQDQTGGRWAVHHLGPEVDPVCNWKRIDTYDESERLAVARRYAEDQSRDRGLVDADVVAVLLAGLTDRDRDLGQYAQLISSLMSDPTPSGSNHRRRVTTEQGEQ
jgi:hypothetical protein